MFRFRGQTKSGEWVVGGLTRGYVNDELRYVYHVEDDELNLHLDIQPGTLSVSTGKLDSNGVEIFASFEIDGVMTTGGDAVSVNGNNYNIKYSPDLASFIAVNVNGKESGKLFHCIDIDNLTIIGNQRRQTMTNAAPRNYVGLEQMLDLARTDEREKIKNQMLDGVMTDSEFEEYTGSKRDQPQGVDVWVSWDDGHFEFPTVTTKQPKENRMKTFSPNEIGGKYYTDLGQNFTIKKEDAEKLGIKKGECAKFKIVRVE